MRDFEPVDSLIATTAPAEAQLAGDVQYYLTLHPRQLPSRYLYDDLGSALFEAICRLPYYGVTRAEQRLLHEHARTIADLSGRPHRLIELGSGGGDKLATLIERGWPLTARQIGIELVDVSGAALAAAEARLSVVQPREIVLHQASYEQGLSDLAQSARREHAMLLFLGSNIGNFDRPDSELFLRNVRAALAPGDTFLLGTDLVKPARILEQAYDDPLGVTAAFNRNLLVRLNRELRADFVLEQFSHRAIWNADESRVEMHLVSTVRQQVQIPAADLTVTFEAGESIWTESSYKYEPHDVVRRLAEARFTDVGQWIDEEGQFALTLARAV